MEKKEEEKAKSGNPKNIIQTHKKAIFVTRNQQKQWGAEKYTHTQHTQ